MWNPVLFAFPGQPLKDLLIRRFSFGEPFKDLFTKTSSFHQPLKEDAVLVFGQTLRHSLEHRWFRQGSSCPFYLVALVNIVEKVPMRFCKVSRVRNLLALCRDLTPFFRSLDMEKATKIFFFWWLPFFIKSTFQCLRSIFIFIVYSAFSYYGQIREGPRHKLDNLIAWFYLEAASMEKKKKGGKEKEKTHSTLQLSLHYEYSGTLSSYIAPPLPNTTTETSESIKIFRSQQFEIHLIPFPCHLRIGKIRWDEKYDPQYADFQIEWKKKRTDFPFLYS